MRTHYKDIIRSLQYLREVLEKRLQIHINKDAPDAFAYPELRIESEDTPLHHFLLSHRLNIEEYIILLLALVPHIQPNFLDSIVQQYLPNGGDFPEMGGVKGASYRGMLPTGETALFLLGGNDMLKRMKVSAYFSTDHFFARENILQLEQVKEGEPRMSGKIILQQEYVDLFTTGVIASPSFGPDFPARLIQTKMDWEDLIINAKTAQQINDLKIWLDHNTTFLKDWGMEKRIKPGFRALFYGPPGTGKTLTATLLGKHFKKDVYRIDLSLIVSKYIGETEKNLEKVFSKAEHRNWILFFDEADALFGKRSSVQSSNDKYANQEVSYLLQRVEDFPGFVILASNYKNNIDQAFIRRFNAVIHFAMPSSAERFEIWKTCIPGSAQLAPDVDLSSIAAKYELSGSAIVNSIHYASLQSICRNSSIIAKRDLLEGIRREYEKEDKVFNP